MIPPAGGRRRLLPRSTALLSLLALTAAPPSAQVVFSDRTAAAGVGYLQHAGQSVPACIFVSYCEPDRMSGGAAVGDVDGDGDPDLFVTRLDAPDILFRNLGDGTFEDATVASGLAGHDHQTNGAAFGDVDNDGDLDLYVTVIGAGTDPSNNRYFLYLNDGSGVFTEEDALDRGLALIGGAHRGYGLAFGDYDRDGWIDAAVAMWQPISGSHNRLFRNLGPASPGFFADTTLAAGVSMPDVYGFAPSFTDVDGDGWQDLVMAADFGTSRLFWNDGDGTFTEGTLAAGVGTDENGMGSTLGDYDLDGDLDWFVTSIWDPDETCDTVSCNWGYSGNRLFRNLGGRVFQDATDLAGVREGYWGWGAAFLDYDNDGDLDLAMTNGVDFPSGQAEDAFITDPMRVWENDGAGVMTEVSAAVGVTDTGSGKGLLVFDYDADGDLDLFVVNNASQPRLYRNDGGNANGWLRVRAVGSISNREGLGARIVVRPSAGAPEQVRELGTSTHFLAQSERVAHFGLGPGTEPVGSLIVRWPSGLVQGFSDVPRNTTLVALEADCVDGDGDEYCLDPDCNDASAAVHPDAPELCDGVDNDCDGFADEDVAGCLAPAGGVPDGDRRPGAPLVLGKSAGADLTLSWSPSCAAGDTDYAIYQGTLGDFSSHTPSDCSTAGATALTLEPRPGDVYFLVAPANGASEGSQGVTSALAERDGAASCLPRVTGACE